MIAGAHDGNNFIVKEYSEADAEAIFKDLFKWICAGGNWMNLKFRMDKNAEVFMENFCNTICI